MTKKSFKYLLGLCLMIGGMFVFSSVAYAAVPAAPAGPDASTIAITNNQEGTSDIVAVDTLTAGDVVKVYSSAKATVPIASKLVATGKTSVTIKITQIGRAAGTLYITVTSDPGAESAKTAKTYIAEKVSTALTAGQVTVTNNPTPKLDTIDITGSTQDFIINVYKSSRATAPIVSDTVDTDGTVTLYVHQLSVGAGTVYVGVQESGKLESPRIALTYTSEITPSISLAYANVINDTGTATDSITVGNLNKDTVVKVYADTKTSTALGSGTVAANGTPLTIDLDLTSPAGGVYVTTKITGKAESPRIKVAYLADTVTAPPLATNITVANKYSASDTLTVTGLRQDDIVKVYAVSKGGSIITGGTGTVASGQTDITISVAQLGVKAGTVYVTVTTGTKSESKRIAKAYTSETSVAPSASKIVVTNNVGAGDTIVVNGLKVGDVVDGYTTTTGGSAFDTQTVSSGTSVTLTKDLGTAAGRVYICVTSTDKSVSARTAVSYKAERALSRIAIKTAATKLVYKVGDTLDITGLVIEGTYNDATKANQDITSANVTGFDSSAVAPSKTLTVTVSGKTVTYTISVIKADGPALTGVTADDSANTLTGYTNATMEYSTDGGANWKADDMSSVDLTGTISVQVRFAADATHNAGAATTFNFLP